MKTPHPHPNPALEHMDNPGDNVLLGPDCPEEFERPTTPLELEHVDENFVPGPGYKLEIPLGDNEVRRLPKAQEYVYCDSCDFYDFPSGMSMHLKRAHGGSGKAISWDEKKASKGPLVRPGGAGKSKLKK